MNKKERVQVMLDPEANNALEREVQLRYMTHSRCTKSSLVNEIVKSHYAILEENATV